MSSSSTEYHRKRDSEQLSGLRPAHNHHQETPAGACWGTQTDPGRNCEESQRAARRAEAGNQWTAEEDWRTSAPGAHCEPCSCPAG